MAVTRRRTHAVVSSRPRRLTEWVQSADVDTFDVLAAGAAVIDQSFTSALNGDLVPGTIVRVRGLLAIRSDQTAAVEQQIGAFGMIIVSAEANTAGVASVPTPIANASNGGWFVWLPFAQGIQAGSTTGNRDTTHFPIDSKAMRKFDSGSDIIVVLENADAAFGLEFWLSFRMLVKLH